MVYLLVTLMTTYCLRELFGSFTPSSSVEQVTETPNNFDSSTLMACRVKSAIWDICLSDRNVFCVYTGEALHTYYYSPASVAGPHVDFVASTSVLPDQLPLILFSGDVYCYASGGK